MSNLSAASELDWSTYSRLLQAYVQPGSKHHIALNVVNYQALSADKDWPKVLDGLAQFNTNQLHTRAEKIAFWINAYNILALDMVIRHRPEQSIRDAGSIFSPVWKKDAGIVSGKMRTLHEIEHKILRPIGEPRMHAAIVCASVGCPDLKPSAYDAAHLGQQLDEQVISFLMHANKGVRIEDNTLHISKIFDWFEDDFQVQGGVLAFIHKYRNDVNTKMTITDYLDYDWSLNTISAKKE